MLFRLSLCSDRVIHSLIRQDVHCFLADLLAHEAERESRRRRKESALSIGPIPRPQLQLDVVNTLIGMCAYGERGLDASPYDALPGILDMGIPSDIEIGDREQTEGEEEEIEVEGDEGVRDGWNSKPRRWSNPDSNTPEHEHIEEPVMGGRDRPSSPSRPSTLSGAQILSLENLPLPAPTQPRGNAVARDISKYLAESINIFCSIPDSYKKLLQRSQNSFPPSSPSSPSPPSTPSPSPSSPDPLPSDPPCLDPLTPDDMQILAVASRKLRDNYFVPLSLLLPSTQQFNLAAEFVAEPLPD